eukprot:scaffold309959_cov39-Tisochrysis_lutea.AAC.1
MLSVRLRRLRAGLDLVRSLWNGHTLRVVIVAFALAPAYRPPSTTDPACRVPVPRREPCARTHA